MVRQHKHGRDVYRTRLDGTTQRGAPRFSRRTDASVQKSYSYSAGSWSILHCRLLRQHPTPQKVVVLIRRFHSVVGMSVAGAARSWLKRGGTASKTKCQLLPPTLPSAAAPFRLPPPAPTCPSTLGLRAGDWLGRHGTSVPFGCRRRPPLGQGVSTTC